MRYRWERPTRTIIVGMASRFARAIHHALSTLLGGCRAVARSQAGSRVCRCAGKTAQRDGRANVAKALLPPITSKRTITTDTPSILAQEGQQTALLSAGGNYTCLQKTAIFGVQAFKRRTLAGHAPAESHVREKAGCPRCSQAVPRPATSDETRKAQSIAGMRPTAHTEMVERSARPESVTMSARTGEKSQVQGRMKTTTPRCRTA